MSKKIKMVLAVVVMLSLAGSAQAAVNYYWGNASGDWNSPGTWANHNPGTRDWPSPASTDQDIAISIGGVTIDVTMAGGATGQGSVDLMAGYSTGVSTINVDAGIFWLILHGGQVGCGNDADSDVATGILNIYGSAQLEQLLVPNSKNDTGIINVYDGGSLVVGYWGCTVGFPDANVFTGASGSINLIKSGSMTLYSALTMNPTGHIDIESGELKVQGDYVTLLQGYVNAGRITSYGGSSPRCPLAVTLLNGWTYVKTTGCTCTTYVQADVNRDCYVDFRDFALLSQGWLDCTNPADANCAQ